MSEVQANAIPDAMPLAAVVPPEEGRILVAMSGGVDSSAAAALLVEQGFRVAGAFMKNWINETEIFGDCPWQKDADDARAVAERLGIPFQIVNLMEDYRERIVEYLIRGYAEGVTPNPDVLCNREIKFGVFRAWARDHGFATVATGHYARSRLNADGSRDILTGSDPNKDQTYFLCLMRPEQVQDARFPIGHLLKPAVRELARRWNLPTAQKKDSQGICFIGNVKMADFLRAYIPDAPGDIILQDGGRVGRHRGLHYFTLGQRRGIQVASPAYRQNYVVVEKRMATRELVVAFDTPATPGLYSSACILASVSAVGRPLDRGEMLQARARYRAPSVPVRYEPLPGGRARVEWSVPQRALACGQICALYDGEVLRGGGVYAAIL
jgi:tRNA-specific 2-thiouridylase